MNHFNQLTPAEDERLAILLEECGEVIQIIGKIQRHGYASRHPNGGPDNRELLMVELGDVQAAISLMRARNDIDRDMITKFEREKMDRIHRYTHHQS